MKTIVLALAVALSFSGCNAQEKRENAEAKASISKNGAEMPQPQGTWKVKKELDENGNLIRYDSIYTYSYGIINGEKMAKQQMDSAMTAFQEYMEKRVPQSFPRDMMVNPLANDSLRDNFFERGVFENHWETFFPEMQQQLKLMDSLHQQFFQETESGLFPPEKRKEKS